jgi:phospholipid/cholesterol/gamma-HCH transport system permease protein
MTFVVYWDFSQIAFMKQSEIENNEKADFKTVIKIPENLDRNWVIANNDAFSDKKEHIVMDFSGTTRIDSSGICFLQLTHAEYKAAHGMLVLRNISADLLSNLQSWVPIKIQQAKNVDKENNVLVVLGNNIVLFKNEVVGALSVLTEMIYWGTYGLLKKRDYRRGTLGEQMYQLGYKALGIVGLLSLLIGVVLSLQTAMQLQSYGAGVFLAPLIGITMVREMGPLLTAIILAGRTGSATTAEIATMGVGEEIDALKTMGINPIQFVVVPKFWAITLTMPLLSILATAAGIMGGFIVATLYLDLSSSMFWSELGKSLKFSYVVAGFIKSVVFSWLIVWIGSFYGFRVRGGAEAVGKETTASVVTGIFIIIMADALFSFIL